STTRSNGWTHPRCCTPCLAARRQCRTCGSCRLTAVRRRGSFCLKPNRRRSFASRESRRTKRSRSPSWSPVGFDNRRPVREEVAMAHGGTPTRSHTARYVGALSVSAILMGGVDSRLTPGQMSLRAQVQNRAAGTPQAQLSAQEGLDQMGIVGYADHLSAQPGDSITFMVSTKAPRYRADIVRIIHGDTNPKGPGMKETPVDTPVNRDYPGKRQTLPLGSYVTVADNPALRLNGSFTLTAWIAPTRHDPLAPGGAAPDVAQGILTKWSPRDQIGYGLF